MTGRWVVAKTEIEFVKKYKQQKKKELAGERYPASHFTVVGFELSRQKMYSGKKNSEQKGIFSGKNPPTNNIELEIVKKSKYATARKLNRI